MKTVIKLRNTPFCPSCGDTFDYKKHRGWFIKTVLSFLDIRKNYCSFCKKTCITIAKKPSAVHPLDQKPYVAKLRKTEPVSETV